MGTGEVDDRASVGAWAAQPVLDAELVDQLVAVPGRRGHSLLHDLVPDLVGSLDASVAQISAALERGEATEAARQIHVLAGSLGAVGARRAATALSSVDAAIRLGGAPSLQRTRLQALRPVLQEAQRALRRLVEPDGVPDASLGIRADAGQPDGSDQP